MKPRRSNIFTLILSIALLVQSGPTMGQPPATRTQSTKPVRTGFVDDPSHTVIEAQNVNLVGHMGGFSVAVFVQGNYAYVGEGLRLTILDISNPVTPNVIGKTAPLAGLIWDIYVSGSIAYVASGSGGLQMIDISSPTAPTRVGAVATLQDARGVYVSGSMVYVADGQAGLRVIDASNPANPMEIGGYDTPVYASGVYVVGTTAYVADGDGGLRIVDVSNPVSPAEVGYYDTLGEALGVYVSDSIVYMAVRQTGLQIVDVSDPSSPSELGLIFVSGYNSNVHVSGDSAYLASGNGGLWVIDVSNPANPSVAGSYDPPEGVWDVYITSNTAYLPDGAGGLRSIDVSNPTNPAPLGFYDAPGPVLGVYVSGNTAYLADGDDSLRVAEVGDPAAPVALGKTTPFTQAFEDIYASGGLAYMARGFGGLRIIDVSTPANPIEVGDFQTSGYAHGVYTSGNTAYLAAGDAGLRVIDVSNPANPTEIGSYTTPSSANGVYVSGSIAYVASGSDGLRVIDISMPSNPVEIGSVELGGDSFATVDVHISGTAAFVVDLNTGLHIIDVTNPTNPIEVGSIDTPGSAETVFASGSLAFVADDRTPYVDASLRVIDVSDPANPVEVSSYSMPETSISDVYASGDTIFVAGGAAGLLVLRYAVGPTYAVSGRVLDVDSNPILGVTISDGAGHTATNAPDGTYVLSGLPASTYTITPSKSGYDFSPPSRTVSVPPDATGVDFLGTFVEPPQVEIIIPSPGAMFYQGGFLLVKAAVMQGGQPLIGASVRGSLDLIGPGYLSFPLYDDGTPTNGDSVTGDGIYAAIITLYGGLTMPTTDNPYDLTVTATVGDQSGSDSTTINVSGHNGAPDMSLTVDGPSMPDYFAGEQVTITAVLAYPDSSTHTDTAVEVTVTLPDLSVTQVSLINIAPDTWRGTYTLPAGQQGGTYYLDAHAAPPTSTTFVGSWSTAQIEVFKAPLALSVTPLLATYHRYAEVPLAACLTAGRQPVSGATVKADVVPPSPDDSITLEETSTGCSGLCNIGCYEAIYQPDSNGTYSVIFGATRSGYKSTTANTTFNVTDDPPVLPEAVTNFGNHAIDASGRALNVAEHIAQDGDWFERKLVSDKIKFWTEAAMDVSSLTVTGAVNTAMPENSIVKLNLPGLGHIDADADILTEILGHTAFSTLKAGTDSTVSSLVFMRPFKYYATGGAPDGELNQPVRDYVEERYQVLVPNDESLRSHFYALLEPDVAALQTGTQSASARVAGKLPVLTVEEEEAYMVDLMRRQRASEWLGYEDLRHRADLLFELQDKREAMQDDFVRKMVIEISELGLKLAMGYIFGPNGTFGGQAGLTVWHAYLTTRDIHEDQILRDNALGLMHRAYGVQGLISSNTLSGLALIEESTPPQTPNGEILGVNLIRTTSALLFTQDVYADVEIKNTGDRTADFFVVAYFCAKKGPGCYRQLLEEMRNPVDDQSLPPLVELAKNEAQTVRLYFKEAGKSDYGTPKYEVMYALYAVTDQGAYLLDSDHWPYQPTSTPAATSSVEYQIGLNSDTSVAGSLTLASIGGVSETERYPLAARVGALTDNLTYTLGIAVNNPFPMPLAVVVSQTIPSEVHISDPGEGFISGDRITWYKVIQPRDTIVMSYDFDYSGVYGEEATLPPLSMSFYDAANDADITLSTDPVVFQAKTPLWAHGDADLTVPPNTQQTVSVEVTNMDITSPQQGDVKLRVWRIDGTEMLNTTAHVSLGAGASQDYGLTYIAPGEGVYVLETSLQYGDNTTAVIYDLLAVKLNQVYLPIVLKNYTPNSQPAPPLNDPPYVPSNPSPPDGATDQSVNVDLSWSGGDPDPDDAVTYDVYFEANDSSPDTLICNDVTSAACDPGTLSHGTHYCWQIIARDSYGVTRTGPVWNFTTGQLPASLALTSPNGGESWHVGTVHNITWSSTGSIANVRLEYSKDGFVSDVHTIAASTPNDGSHPWTVPNDPSTTVHVRVSDASNPSTSDISSANWVIYNNPPYPPSNPTPPNGATDQSVDVNLSWTGGDPDGDSVTYDVYLDANDTSPTTLVCNDVTSTACDPGTLSYATHYYWQIIARDSHGSTRTGPVWNFTTGQSPTNLTLTSPNGGENWHVGTVYNITWSSTGSIANVRLEYSKDGFVSDVHTIVASTPNDGTHPWTVPNDPSTTVRVRVSDTSNPSTNDISNGNWVIYNNPPNPPSNPTPPNGATNQSVDVNLSWSGGDPDGDSVTYDVYLDANDTSPTTLVCTDVTSPTCDPGTLSYDTPYYWLVVARDEHGAIRSQSVWNFTTGPGNNPPNPPSNPTPPNGATNQSVDVNLSWTGGDPDGDNVTYDVYLDANDTSPTTLVCNDVPSPTCDPGTLSYDTPYYWLVVARDEHGAIRSQSVWNFTTGPGNNPPNPPSNPTPPNGATNQSVDVNLSWTGGDPDGDNVTYDVYLDANDTSPTTLVCNDVSSPICDPGTLSYDTPYYWLVVARDEHGAIRSQSVWNFTTGPGNNPPNPPSNPTPPNGATNQSVDVNLSWTGGDPDGDSVTYDVYLDANDTSPTTLVCNDVPSPTCDPGTLSYDTPYSWLVVARDEHGAIRSQSVWSFTTETSLPPAVQTLHFKVSFQARDNADNKPQNVPIEIQIKNLDGQIAFETNWLEVTPAGSSSNWGTVSVDVSGAALTSGQSYQIFVTGAMHLAKRVVTALSDGLTVDYTDPALNPDGVLWTCDINQDNQVSETDVNIIGSHSDEPAPTNPDPSSELYRSDQNGDAVINLIDIVICAQNVGKVGD